MDKGGLSFFRAVFILVNGKMIKCMGMENYIMKMEELLMKEIGRITNFPVMEESLMSHQKKCWDHSIIEIFPILGINGCFMKEIFKMIVNMEKGKLDCQMVRFFRDCLLKILLKAKAFFIQQKDKLFKDFGKTTFFKTDF